MTTATFLVCRLLLQARAQYSEKKRACEEIRSALVESTWVLPERWWIRHKIQASKDFNLHQSFFSLRPFKAPTITEEPR